MEGERLAEGRWADPGLITQELEVVSGSQGVSPTRAEEIPAGNPGVSPSEGFPRDEGFHRPEICDQELHVVCRKRRG